MFGLHSCIMEGILEYSLLQSSESVSWYLLVLHTILKISSRSDFRFGAYSLTDQGNSRKSLEGSTNRQGLSDITIDTKHDSKVNTSQNHRLCCKPTNFLF